ncbi:MAG: hypothetical protein AB2729_12635 [Candidatus Thiodiazotropha taylori]|uniref:Uncharacterized protein n=1 Tax=Candidatus Thiodiazotropha taylori TaxID=2792791 RepID=A0A9E4N7B4_9GAMM|nr:hypothetical protein [Candidatus Thiodiazotropha taylori]MCG7956036.1 hypothetical protein [Candidatus Thiodiazotropha taylori]MCG8039772.1 hypothetical protein [Candidatus Thiodiazotropha taylori]MCG8049867.1 hypothetical protein [Candidatus Thiodiazotropha taylori]MCG8057268.1 hypothetical protein [Candidatus Thiodiazotropha taylori]
MTIHDYFLKRPILTFLLLIVSALAFGFLTINIFRLLAANWQFIVTYGVVALREGALWQTLELILTGIVSMLFFLIFRFCEDILISWFGKRKIGTEKNVQTDGDQDVDG